MDHSMHRTISASWKAASCRAAGGPALGLGGEPHRERLHHPPHVPILASLPAVEPFGWVGCSANAALDWPPISSA